MTEQIWWYVARSSGIVALALLILLRRILVNATKAPDAASMPA